VGQLSLDGRLHFSGVSRDGRATLRSARIDDRDFLRSVYASAREEELAPVPWTEAEKAAFVDQQFAAQDAHYRANYPNPHFMIIELEGVPVGRLYHSQLDPTEVRVMDIALLASHRGRGLGTELIVELVEAAHQSGAMVSLHVEHWNPAVALYERLGFVRAGSDDINIRMESRPPTSE
jgi:ribosomal protein S18 acetylase RimI-like enzyme